MINHNFTIKNCEIMFKQVQQKYPLMKLKIAITDVKNTGQIDVFRVEN